MDAVVPQRDARVNDGATIRFDVSELLLCVCDFFTGVILFSMGRKCEVVFLRKLLRQIAKKLFSEQMGYETARSVFVSFRTGGKSSTIPTETWLVGIPAVADKNGMVEGATEVSADVSVVANQVIEDGMIEEVTEYYLDDSETKFLAAVLEWSRRRQRFRRMSWPWPWLRRRPSTTSTTAKPNSASVNQANKDGLVYDGNQTDEDGMVEEAYEASNCSKNQQVHVKSTESGPSA